MRIALVKQDVYQDLYVCANRTAPAKALESTIMRVGPLGLFTLCDADFFILREDGAPECKAYKKSYRPPEQILRQLPNTPVNAIEGSTFDFLSPRSGHAHSDFSVGVEDVAWESYDVVVSINIAVPGRIVKKTPSVLWCYMMGEASRGGPYVEYGYDVSLTQEVTGSVAGGLGPVDFPYSFIGPDCLEAVADEFGAAPAERRGVYAEINTTAERPVSRVPSLEFVRELGHDVIVHHQDIIENVLRLRRSKYFAKLGGRKIRGNSVIEAISAGSLVLMDPKDLVHSQLLPKETWARSEAELRGLVSELDRDDRAYAELLAEQRKRLRAFVVDAPLESLRNCVEAKRADRRPPRPDIVSILREIKRNYL
jgi:hypothetical protein